MTDVRVHVAAHGSSSNLDLAHWFTEAARLAGRTAELVTDRPPDADRAIAVVVAPHEYFELADLSVADAQRAAGRCVCIATGDPTGGAFERTVDAGRLAMATYDVSQEGVAALQARGIEARHLQLGAVPSMSVGSDGTPDAASALDVMFVGIWSERRGAVLADLAPTLVHRRSALHLAIDEPPITAHTLGVLEPDARRRHISMARTLLDIRRTESSAFAWARAVEAMANGCVVVADRPVDGPLVAGVHYVAAPTDCPDHAVAELLDELLDDEARRRYIAGCALDLVTGELGFHRAVDALLTRLERDRPTPRRPRVTRWLAGDSHRPAPVRLAPFRPFARVRNAAQLIALAESAALRRIDATRSVLRHGDPRHVQRFETQSFADAEPEVSVVVSVYNYADVVEQALCSVIASEDVAFEIIVVDDHATDHSRAAIRRVLDEHPGVPMLLVGKDANEGLAAARNSAFELSRSPLVMVLDADNEVSPTCLRRLADALDAHPDADAAYGILEDFGEHRGVRSAFPWDVRQLCKANYIDAQAMIRKETWARLGGYRGDDEVFGWEDWDLWLRLARVGGRALLVPELLGRYRVHQGSMIALTNLGHDRGRTAMRARYPELPWGE